MSFRGHTTTTITFWGFGTLSGLGSDYKILLLIAVVVAVVVVVVVLVVVVVVVVVVVSVCFKILSSPLKAQDPENPQTIVRLLLSCD